MPKSRIPRFTRISFGGMLNQLFIWKEKKWLLNIKGGITLEGLRPGRKTHSKYRSCLFALNNHRNHNQRGKYIETLGRACGPVILGVVNQTWLDSIGDPHQPLPPGEHILKVGNKVISRICLTERGLPVHKIKTSCFRPTWMKWLSYLKVHDLISWWAWKASNSCALFRDAPPWTPRLQSSNPFHWNKSVILPLKIRCLSQFHFLSSVL